MKPLTAEQHAQITYEDSTPDEHLTPLELKRKRNRAVKRRTRETEKQEKANQKKDEATWKVQLKQRAEQDARDKVLDSLDDHHAFWQLQRESLTADQKVKYEAIHDEMTEWTLVMADYVNGTDHTTEEDFADTIHEVVDLMKTANPVPTQLLLVPRFWTKAERSIFNRVADRSEAARIFANYGYLLGPLANTYQQFYQKFIHPRGHVEKPSTVVMECSVCRKIASRTSVPQSIADSYKLHNIPYKCTNCRQSESAHMNRVVEYKSVVSKTTPFDQFGRVKDFSDE